MSSFAALDAPPRRIVVLRALMLGDMLCAMPALRAIRRAWPRAHIALVGLPIARELLARLPHADELIAFPGWPGLPEWRADLAAVPEFLYTLQQGRWDLAIQLQGSGTITNPLVALFGAGATAGFFAPGAFVPAGDEGRYRPWPGQGHETQRLLALCRHLGLPIEEEALEFPLRADDEAALRRLWPGWEACPGYVCVHAGARLASRRWPIERFAAVAAGLHAQGYRIVLTGAADERPLAETLTRLLLAAGVAHIDLVGRTGLWTLGALLRRAALLLCNDTGVSHIAAALRSRSLVVSCGSEIARWAPPDKTRHRVLAATPPCRPCAHADCPIGHGCALALTVEAVLAAARDLLRNDKEAPCRVVACAS